MKKRNKIIVGATLMLSLSGLIFSNVASAHGYRNRVWVRYHDGKVVAKTVCHGGRWHRHCKTIVFRKHRHHCKR